MVVNEMIPKKSEPIAGRFKIRLDVWLVLTVLSLLIMGTLNVYSTSFDIGFVWKDAPLYYFKRQMVALMLGVIFIALFLQVDYPLLKKFSTVGIAGLVSALVLVLIFGTELNGARRGFFGGSFQPAEIGKLIMIVYVAHWLSSKGNRIRNWEQGLLPFAIMIGVLCGLIFFQPDTGTILLYLGISFSMYFLAGAKWTQAIYAILAVVLVFSMALIFHSHTKERIQNWKDALTDPDVAIGQVQRGKQAIGTGGLTGEGLGRGVNKFLLPAVHTDGAFAGWAEETGFIGSVIAIATFGMLIWRGTVIAQRARSDFGYLLAMGITCWIGYQSLIHLAVAVNIMPVTGMPLPFFSYGGMSMLTTLGGIGILLNISRDTAIGKTLKPAKSALESTRENSNLRRRDRRTRLSRAGRSRSAKS